MSALWKLYHGHEIEKQYRIAICMQMAHEIARGTSPLATDPSTETCLSISKKIVHVRFDLFSLRKSYMQLSKVAIWHFWLSRGGGGQEGMT
jgi:hypothetical protein